MSYDPNAFLVALVTDLDTAVKATGAAAAVCDGQPPATDVETYAVVYLLGLGPDHGSMSRERMWPQQIQVTSVGRTPAQARSTHKLVHDLLTGADDAGAYTHPLDLGGPLCNHRESNRDGHPEKLGVLFAHVETFTLDLQLP